MNSPMSLDNDAAKESQDLASVDPADALRLMVRPDEGGRNRAPRLLHVGCGSYAREKLPIVFRTARTEIRLDIDPAVQPDIVATLTDMRAVPDNSIDAIYSSHNLEHLWPHEVPLALR